MRIDGMRVSGPFEALQPSHWHLRRMKFESLPDECGCDGAHGVIVTFDWDLASHRPEYFERCFDEGRRMLVSEVANCRAREAKSEPERIRDAILAEFFNGPKIWHAHFSETKDF